MKDSETKIKLFHEIDLLATERLIELYGVVKSFINGIDNSEDWNALTSTQKNGIQYGIEELEEGKGIKHDLV